MASKETTSGACDQGHVKTVWTSSVDSGPMSWQARDSNSQPMQKKGAVQILQRFAERCSMHGPSYIYTSTRRFSRLAWSLLLIAALAAMSYHLHYLIKSYLRWPTKEQLSLGFASLQFPAVTVCNVNPIRLSMLGQLSDDLQTFLQHVDPDIMGDSIDNSVKNSSTSSPPRQRRETSDDDDDNTQLDDIDWGYSTSNLNKAREEVEEGFYDDLNGDGDSWEKEAKSSSVSRMEQVFQELYAAENSAVRVKTSHQLKDMLLSCSFAGQSCYARNFTLVTSSTLGNCFTLQYSKFVSRSSGPSGGLELLFFLDTEEYIRGITPGDGLQVNIHPQNTVAFPVDEGVAVAAGSQTLLSLKLLQVKRKGLPYSDCSQDSEYLEKHQVLYTRQTCHKLCEQREIQTACQCRDETADDVNMLMNATTFPPCRTKQDVMCLLRALWRYQNGALQCSCTNPCREAKYQKSISTRPWPSKEYADNVLVKMTCRRVSAQKCQRLKTKGSQELASEFAKLNIFFEDLNYETVTEVPDYETVHFISKVGGTLVLWIGVSMLSVMEVLQLGLEFFRHLCACRWNSVGTTK